MAKRTVGITTITPTATADTTNLVDATYPFLIGGNVAGGGATQRTVIYEIMLGGQAGSSAPTFMLLSRDSTIGITISAGTGVTDAANDPATAALALPIAAGNTCTTKPQRSSTLHLGNFSLNCFGGIIRYSAAPGQEFSIVGNAGVLSEVSLSAFTGGTPGPLGAHMVYETA